MAGIIHYRFGKTGRQCLAISNFESVSRLLESMVTDMEEIYFLVRIYNWNIGIRKYTLPLYCQQKTDFSFLIFYRHIRKCIWEIPVLQLQMKNFQVV